MAIGQLATIATEWGRLPKEQREWAEKYGYDNLKGRIEVGGMIASQAATTLTLLLTGIGGSLAYGIKIFEPGSGAIAFGAAWICAYLTLLAIVLFAGCVTLADAPALFPEPQNVLIPSTTNTWESVRLGELANLQVRIDQMKARNIKRARILDAVRWAAIATPLLFALSVLYYR